MAPIEILLSLFWIAAALVVIAAAVLIFLKESVWAVRVVLGLCAVAFFTLFGFLVSAGMSAGELIQKRVTWAGGGSGIPAVEIGLSFSAGTSLLILLLALVPVLALANPGWFRSDAKSERQTVALLPLLSALIFGLFAAGFWSVAVSGALLLLSMGIGFSSQWELVGESHAMERSLRDFAMGLVLADFSRLYFLIFPGTPMLVLIVLAALMFSRVGPFVALSTQELLAQGQAWRRLILEWMPRLTGMTLISLLLFESGALTEYRAWVMVLAAIGLFLTTTLTLGHSSSARTSGGVLSSLGIWGIFIATAIGWSHFKVAYLWLWLSGWSVLSVQDLLRTSQGDRPRSTQQATLWVKFVLILLCAGLLGAPGRLGATLFLAAFQSGTGDALAEAGLVFGYFFYALSVLAWAVRVWRESRQQAVLSAGLAVPILSGGVFLALMWNGTLTGGWLEDGGVQIDQVAQGLFSSQFSLGLGSVDTEARGLLAGALFLAVVVSAIVFRGGVDRLAHLRARLPGFYRFLDEGLGCERIASRAWEWVSKGGAQFIRIWENQFLERGIYRGIFSAIQWIAQRLNLLGQKGDGASVRTLDSLFKSPGLLAQVFQDGDVRWYLFWGILISSLILLRQGWFQG